MSTKRVLRSGSWYAKPWFLRSTLRDWDNANFRSRNIGFRLIRREHE